MFSDYLCFAPQPEVTMILIADLSSEALVAQKRRLVIFAVTSDPKSRSKKDAELHLLLLSKRALKVFGE